MRYNLMARLVAPFERWITFPSVQRDALSISPMTKISRILFLHLSTCETPCGETFRITSKRDSNGLLHCDLARRRLHVSSDRCRRGLSSWRFFLVERLRPLSRSELEDTSKSGPRIKQGYALNLSILLSAGEENNNDPPSNGE